MDCRPFFFKRFGMFHHRSTMRIGTDAVLFAQWVDVKPSDCALDIGTGSGVIPLILSQKPIVLPKKSLLLIPIPKLPKHFAVCWQSVKKKRS